MAFDVSSYTLQQLVERATSDMLLAPDWEKNFMIVEEIRSQPTSAINVIEYIKQRLLHQEQDVVFLALCLLETLMQNNYEVIPILNTESYQTVLYNLGASDRTPFKVRNKVLDLVQVWAEGLRQYQLRPRNNYVGTFNYLRGKGVKFPPVGPNTAKYTPPARPEAPAPTPGVQPSLRAMMGGATAASPPQPTRESKEVEKLVEVGTHVDLVMEIFAGCDPRVERMDQNEIVRELLPTLDQFARKNRQWVESGNVPESLFGPVLELNDRLVLLQECYDELCKGNRHPALDKQQSQPQPQQAQPQQAQPQPKSSFTAFDLFDQSSGPLVPAPSSSSSSVLAPAPPSPIRPPSPQNAGPHIPNPHVPSPNLLAPTPFAPTPIAPTPVAPTPFAPNPAPQQKEDDDIMAAFGELASRHG